MDRSFVIAMDGPAASGKGTLARKAAELYQFAYLDTGSLYRGVAAMVLASGVDPEREDGAAEIARGLSLDALETLELRTPEVSKASSIVAKHGAVRAALLDFQREFADRRPGAILDGRDIGTVICPNANVKLFITATSEVRAERRWRERLQSEPGLGFDVVLADIKERDERDQNRASAPLMKAEDAVLIDTTHLSIDAAFAAVREVIDKALTDQRPV